MSKVRLTVRIDFDRDNAIGPGKIALLEKMRDSGSLSQAARELNMSYRRAWQLLNSLNLTFREPLVLTSIGGTGGGGTTLTAFGESIVSSYRRFEKEMNARAQKYFGSVADKVGADATASRRSIVRRTTGTRQAPRRAG